MSEPSSIVAQITCVMLAPNREWKRRIRFGRDLGVILLNSVIACDAHIADLGTMQHKLEEVSKILIITTPKEKLQDVTSLTWNKIYEMFKNVASVYRASDRRISITLRVEGIRTELEMILDGIITELELLLDDIIQLHEEHQENRHNKKRTETERRLQIAGERIRKAPV